MDLSHYTYAQIQAMGPWVAEAEAVLARWERFSEFMKVLRAAVEDHTLTPAQARTVFRTPPPTSDGKI